MKKLVFASILALGTSTLLAGCGLGIIPPVELNDDPLQLNGAILTTTLSKTSTPTLSTRTPGAGKIQVNALFPDVSSVNIPITPSGISIKLALDSVTFTPGCVPALTQSVNVTLTNFNLKLSDSTTRSWDFSVPSASFDVNVAAGTVSGSGVNSLNYVINNIATVTDILTKDPTPNTVTVGGDVATTPALPGCEISIKLAKSTAKLSF